MKYRILFLSALAVLIFSGTVFATSYAGTDPLVAVASYAPTAIYNLNSGASAGSVWGYWYADHGISMPYTKNNPSDGWVIGCNPRIDPYTPLTNYNSRQAGASGGDNLVDVGSQFWCLAADNDWEGAAKAYFVSNNRLVRIASDGALNNWDAGRAAAVAPEAFTDVGQSFVDPGAGTWNQASAYAHSNFADVEIIGQNAYWTMGKGTGAAKLFMIDKHFANGAARTQLLDATAMGVAGATEARGFTLDAAGNIYMIINETTVAKFNSTGTTCLNAAFLTGTQLTDIDYASGKLILGTSTGAQVYDLNQNLLRTLGSGPVHGLETIAAVPEPSSIAGIAMGAMSLLAVIRRRK
jgi:hypothetical protein